LNFIFEVLEIWLSRNVLTSTVYHIAKVGGICNIDASNKQLLLVCGNARQKYAAYLEEWKVKKQAATAWK